MSNLNGFGQRVHPECRHFLPPDDDFLRHPFWRLTKPDRFEHRLVIWGWMRDACLRLGARLAGNAERFLAAIHYLTQPSASSEGGLPRSRAVDGQGRAVVATTQATLGKYAMLNPEESRWVKNGINAAWERGVEPIFYGKRVNQSVKTYRVNEQLTERPRQEKSWCVVVRPWHAAVASLLPPRFHTGASKLLAQLDYLLRPDPEQGLKPEVSRGDGVRWVTLDRYQLAESCLLTMDQLENTMQQMTNLSIIKREKKHLRRKGRPAWTTLNLDTLTSLEGQSHLWWWYDIHFYFDDDKVLRDRL